MKKIKNLLLLSFLVLGFDANADDDLDLTSLNGAVFNKIMGPKLDLEFDDSKFGPQTKNNSPTSVSQIEYSSSRSEVKHNSFYCSSESSVSQIEYSSSQPGEEHNSLYCSSESSAFGEELKKLVMDSLSFSNDDLVISAGPVISVDLTILKSLSGPVFDKIMEGIKSGDLEFVSNLELEKSLKKLSKIEQKLIGPITMLSRNKNGIKHNK